MDHMNVPTQAAEPAAAGSYARFAKRDLDKMSWLAPLVNNPIGDLLNIELRHEQLFFVADDRVVENIGYSEKGKRFSESDYGKQIASVGDLARFGYWFVGRSFDPEIMKEALRRQIDGYYYSILSNQCQDWADRLKRGAARIERERGLARRLGREARLAASFEEFVLPTEPASIAMGLVALALGVGGFVAPVVAGAAFTAVIGTFFLASGLSHAFYAFHGKEWRNLLPELLIASINLVAGTIMLSNRDISRVTGGVIVALSLAVHGGFNVVVSLFNRPRSHWIGKLIAGVLMLGAATMVVAHWPMSGDRALGAAVGVSLLAGGLSTILLNWKTRASREHEAIRS
jgi:uncharacterized membrane protein HdeD (DUF308 family)